MPGHPKSSFRHGERGHDLAGFQIADVHVRVASDRHLPLAGMKGQVLNGSQARVPPPEKLPRRELVPAKLAFIVTDYQLTAVGAKIDGAHFAVDGGPPCHNRLFVGQLPYLHLPVTLRLHRKKLSIAAPPHPVIEQGIGATSGEAADLDIIRDTADADSGLSVHDGIVL